MIITFCGHADFQNVPNYEKQVLSCLEKIIKDDAAQLYSGGYGNFDRFAHQCGKLYQSTHPNVQLILITPYISTTKSIDPTQYDAVIYPELETVPAKFAILQRNRWMIDQADTLIAYVNHRCGGAYQTYQYARKKKISLINLADFPS